MFQVQKFHQRKLFLLIVLFTLSVAICPWSASAAPLSQDNPVYIVQQGDTLNSIALRFGIPADDILSANEIPNPNSLNIGQRIVIPGLEGISGVLTSLVLPYGTSLTNLNSQYNLNKNDLIVLNHLTSPSETVAGIRFIVPVDEDQPPLEPIQTILPAATLIESAIKTGTSPWIVLKNNPANKYWTSPPGDILFGTGDEELSVTNLPGVTAFSLNLLPIIQGETLQVSLSASEPLEFTGDFDDEPLNFFSEDGESYHAFLGIHALSKTGVFPLSITASLPDGSSYSFEQLVLLSPGGYAFQPVNIPKDPDTYLDETVSDEENAYLLPIITQASSEKHWDGKFQYPVDEPCINSTFGLRRDYNNGRLFFYHTGMDFAVCAPNLNIYAPAPGKVVVAEELVIRGNAILIDHGWGIFSGYWHLSEFNVQAGDFVQPGDLLGLIGDTGRSAGPHLHFEIDIMGTPVNPETWLTETFP